MSAVSLSEIGVLAAFDDGDDDISFFAGTALAFGVEAVFDFETVAADAFPAAVGVLASVVVAAWTGILDAEEAGVLEVVEDLVADGVVTAILLVVVAVLGVVVLEALEVAVEPFFVGVLVGEERTNDLEPPTMPIFPDEGDRGILLPEGEEARGIETPGDGETRAPSVASFFSREERSRAPVEGEDGLATAAAAFLARSGEVLRLADRLVDLLVERELMRDPAEDAGGVGSKPSISAISSVVSESVSVAFTLESTSCRMSLAWLGELTAKCI